MPIKRFLEEYPLYRKFGMQTMPNTADQLPDVRIKMMCPTCQSEQTFTMTNKYFELCPYSNYPLKGLVFRMAYLCSHCQRFERFFFIATDKEGKWFMKVGQVPPWETKGDPQIEKLLGRHADYYRKGLTCESQGYGIGAFGYYRRIVEEIIDELLDQVSELMTGDELKSFKVALEKTKQTIVAQEKIELAKDVLPPILRPEGMNPLSVLHSALSEGLHAASDEDCLEQASIIREVLTFLVNQVATSKTASKAFSDGMRKLLEKKSVKAS
jgi:hypothetical protein